MNLQSFWHYAISKYTMLGNAAPPSKWQHFDYWKTALVKKLLDQQPSNSKQAKHPTP